VKPVDGEGGGLDADMRYRQANREDTAMKLKGRPFVWMVAALLTAPAAGLAQEQLREAAGVRYISGGVGEESQARLAAQAAQFNVRVIFALKAGNYLSGVEASVWDGSGKPVFSTVTEGPWLYLRLAPGNYVMRAALGGQKQEQKLVAPAQGSRQLVFRWEREE
jgi:hypothetical protein